MNAFAHSSIRTGLQAARKQPPFVCIVVLNYNGAPMTFNCVESVLKFDYPNFKVIVVDNASADDSAVRLREALSDPRVELFVNDKNEGYAGGNNRGISKALSEGAKYILVLNNDTVAEPGCLRSLVKAMQADPGIGIGGCEIVDTEHGSSNQGEKINLFTSRVRHLHHPEPVLSPVDVDFICGAAIMLRAETVGSMGAFDSNLFMFCEDADICFRARQAGYRVCFIPGPGVRHFMGCSTRGAPLRPLVSFYLSRNHIWIVRRHGNLMQRVLFTVLNLSYKCPRVLLTLVLRRQFSLLLPTLQAVWDGHLNYIPCPHDTTLISKHAGLAT